MKVEYLLDASPVCPALYKLSGERQPAWTCQCRRPDGRRLLRTHRHASEIDCVPKTTVDAFKARHGLKSDGHAKALLFIETFAPLVSRRCRRR